VWAGEGDCSQDANRLGTTAICKPVAPTSRTTSASLTVPVRVQDLVADLETKPKPVIYSKAGSDACNAQSSPSGRTLAVWFLLLNGSTVAASQSFKTSTSSTSTGTTGTATSQEGVVVDMKGPPAVTSVVASSGDRRLRLEWTPSGDQDARGYVLYCQRRDQVPSDGGASTTTPVCDAGATSTPDVNVTPADAGTTDAGAADASDAGDAAFNVPVLDSGPSTSDDAGCSPGSTSTTQTCPQPVISAATECGRIPTKTNVGFTDRTLENLVEYSVAVAAIDAFDNVGDPAPATECASPEAVDDFWKRYNEAGGQGGGYCALEAVGLPVGSNAAAIALCVLGFAVARRRKGKKAS
jgi:hypothetical protein